MAAFAWLRQGHARKERSAADRTSNCVEYVIGTFVPSTDTRIERTGCRWSDSYLNEVSAELCYNRRAVLLATK
jgi:hypothetical protein